MQYPSARNTSVLPDATVLGDDSFVVELSEDRTAFFVPPQRCYQHSFDVSKLSQQRDQLEFNADTSALSVPRPEHAIVTHHACWTPPRLFDCMCADGIRWRWIMRQRKCMRLKECPGGDDA